MFKKSRLKKETDYCQEAFHAIKPTLRTLPIVGQYKRGCPLILYTAYIGKSVRVILTQSHEGVERVLSSVSFNFDKYQEKYTISELELLAIVKCCDKFRAIFIEQ